MCRRLKLTDFLARIRNEICTMNMNSICNVNTLTPYNDFHFNLLWHMQIILHMSHMLFCYKIWESLATLLISCDSSLMYNGHLWSSISISKVSSWSMTHTPVYITYSRVHKFYTTTCNAMAEICISLNSRTSGAEVSCILLYSLFRHPLHIKLDEANEHNWFFKQKHVAKMNV